MPSFRSVVRNGARLWPRPWVRVGAVTFAAANAVMILAWRLADDRIGLCRTPSCPQLATAARDATLVNGLTINSVAILIFVMAMRKSGTGSPSHSTGQSFRAPVAEVPLLKVVGRPAPINKISRLRALTVAVAFGMVLAGGLLWADGLLQLGGLPKTDLAAGRAQPAPTQGNPFSNLIPPDLPAAGSGKQGSTEGYEDLPMAAPRATSDEVVDYPGTPTPSEDNGSTAPDVGTDE